MRRKRSSGISSLSYLGSSLVGINPDAAYHSSFSASRVRRRRRSIALYRAVLIIQARGRAGMPLECH
nr:hypothetical protein [Chroococcidiopsis cubana]